MNRRLGTEAPSGGGESPGSSAEATQRARMAVLTGQPQARSGMSKDNRRRRFKALALFAALMTVVVAFFAGFAVAAARDPANDQHASMPESPGFLPAEGWDVFQTGTTEPPQAPTATASNVPLDPRDEIGGLPHPTLESLGSDGIVIFATFYPAGESVNVDRQFPGRLLPLSLTDTKPGGIEGQPDK